jgi:Putative serine esterase (DUF676).
MRVVFVAHSLGGLVVRYAIYYSGAQILTVLAWNITITPQLEWFSLASFTRDSRL